MPSVRQRVRSEFVARCTGITHAVGNPKTSRSRIVPESDVPAIVVSIASDTRNGFTNSSFFHELAFEIECIAKPVGSTAGVDVAEEMAAEIEARMSEPIELATIEWVSTTFGEESEGQQPFHTASLRFTMEYATPRGLDVADPVGG